MKLVTAEEMRRIERESDARGITYAIMMENAGQGIADAIRQRVDVAERHMVMLVGPGNNGGDGLVAARHLHDAGARLACYLWKRAVEDDENYRLVQERSIPCPRVEDDKDLAHLRQLLSQADVVIDALLGTGIARPIKGVLKSILGTLGEVHASRQADLSGLPIPYLVAVDVPTGLNVDTGALDPATVPCDLTVTFANPKRGQYLFPGAGAVGELVVADIGTPPELSADVKTEVATASLIRSLLPERPLNAHKGTFGKVLVVAGSVNYTGAAYLAGAAATRVGAGLVTMAVVEPLYPIIASRLTEATYLVLPHDMGVLVPAAIRVLEKELPGRQALLLGCGFGREERTVEFVHALLGVRPRAVRPRLGFHPGEGVGKEERLELPPLVIDADGLNALAQAEEWWTWFKRTAILTPHPGEMARLAGLSTAEVETDRMGVAERTARQWGQVVVLKGAYSIIAGPDGRLVVNPFANPGLASAGTGDVLAGAIVGMLAQGLAPFDAAVAGCYLHGLAGELARQELGDAGIVAGDLIPRLPLAIRALKSTDVKRET